MDGTVPAVGYSSTGKLLHWLIAVLVLAQFVVSFLMPDISMRTPPSALVNLHLSLGVTILVVMAIRFVPRLAHPAPIDDRLASLGADDGARHAPSHLFHSARGSLSRLASASAHNRKSPGPGW